MKDNDYKRIEDQLDPDDRLVQNVMDKAAQFSANSALEEEYLKEHDVPDAVKVRRSNGYRYMLSTAAAVALVLGVNVYIHSNSPVKPREPETASAEKTAEDVTESTTETEFTENAPSAEIPADETESTADTPESNADDSAVENIGIGRLEWKPDRTADSFETESGDGQAAVLAPAADLYRSFELNGKTYQFACGSYGEIYDDPIVGYNIPNDSYICEFLTNVEVPSMFGDSLPSAQAEVYNLMFADPNYLVAVRFIDVNGDDRYYLFADMDHSFDTLKEHLIALNIDIYTFDGTAIIRRDGVRSFIDDDTELKEMLLSADGEKTDTACGEAVCEIYLDTPLYGGSVGYTVYSDGYISVINGFGSESVYDVGTETTSQLIEYINENAHS
ncbi:hypothetical protein [uncultured Ruminococcus sp.]|uniref:hypothetical protein n=1 Tax=uncultured Ruminococcus sp. TaxID=165186 RepID=UPI0025FB2822|nr:hypothetical protein [uncultured Ruminococcus sp.]